MKHDYTSGPLERGPRGSFTKHSGDIRYIAVHYLWSRIDTDWPMSKVAQMHERENGWNGPGYHYLIRRDGSLEYGRPEWARGAHVRGHNDRSIGVAYEGGRIPGDNQNGHDTRTQEQRDRLNHLVGALKAKYPNAQVVGHRDLTATQCPGFDAKAWWVKAKAKPAPEEAKPISGDKGLDDPRGLIAVIGAALVGAFLWMRGR